MAPPSLILGRHDADGMGELSPIAFDIETTGLEREAVVTVAGLATDVGAWLALNTGDRDVDATRLAEEVERASGSHVRLSVSRDEGGLLADLEEFAGDRLDGDRHYLTAFNGEQWRSGFDLPFLRSACVRRGVPWPFPGVAYADTMTMVERFETGEADDLVGVHEALIGGDHCDPFDDSERAVAAHEAGDWVPLLLHNLADVERTRELAVLAGQYVPRSDFRMKNLEPPDR